MDSSPLEIDFTIVGAGVVGLAVAERISRQAPEASVLIVERHPKFGQEISSHNSEVIHAGIYYAPGSQKALLCVRGRELLYAFCRDHEIPHFNCGKYIVATDAAQLGALEQIQASAERNGVHLERVASRDLSERLRNPGAIEALWSQTTGIVDSHSLMERLEAMVHGRGVTVLYEHRFLQPTAVSPGQVEFLLQAPDGKVCSVKSRALINCAGLGAGRIAQAFMPDEQIEIRPCRGRYFTLSGRWTHAYKQLIYPIPDPTGGLGVHLTFDLGGKCRLGPDVHWPSPNGLPADDPLHYQFDADVEKLQRSFFESGKRLLPDLRETDLSPDYVGVRPKLFVRGVAAPDFVFKKSSEKSPDWHLLGIESPGLTAALAVAEHVVDEVLES